MHPVGPCRIYYVTLLAKNVRIRLRAFGALAGRSRAYLLAGAEIHRERSAPKGQYRMMRLHFSLLQGGGSHSEQEEIKKNIYNELQMDLPAPYSRAKG